MKTSTIYQDKQYCLKTKWSNPEHMYPIKICLCNYPVWEQTEMGQPNRKPNICGLLFSVLDLIVSSEVLSPSNCCFVRRFSTWSGLVQIVNYLSTKLVSAQPTALMYTILSKLTFSTTRSKLNLCFTEPKNFNCEIQTLGNKICLQLKELSASKTASI